MWAVPVYFQKEGGLTTVNTSDLTSGIYFYEIDVDGQRYHGKFVKQ